MEADMVEVEGLVRRIYRQSTPAGKPGLLLVLDVTDEPVRAASHVLVDVAPPDDELFNPTSVEDMADTLTGARIRVRGAGLVPAGIHDTHVRLVQPGTPTLMGRERVIQSDLDMDDSVDDFAVDSEGGMV
jgi:hypothetical protein